MMWHNSTTAQILILIQLKVLSKLKKKKKESFCYFATFQTSQQFLHNTIKSCIIVKKLYRSFAGYSC